MKMGTIASPWHYDAGARDTLQLASLRCPAIQNYATWTAAFPIPRDGPVTLPSIAALPVNARIDAMGDEPT